MHSILARYCEKPLPLNVIDLAGHWVQPRSDGPWDALTSPEVL
jgi:hypothetical protein